MKTRTMIQLLSLGANLYMMSQDKELMEKLSSMAAEGKQKLDDWWESGENEDDASVLEKLKTKAREVEAKMEEKLEETATKVYQKLHIAHVRDVEALKAEIESLRAEIAAMKGGKPA